MDILREQLANRPVVYITRDIERALGLSVTPGYSIITNTTTFAKQVAENRIDIVLIDAGRVLDTYELLKCTPPPLGKEGSSAQGGGGVVDQRNIIIFKNTKQIEEICKKNSWKLLNPSAALANKVEEKISQVEWLGDLTRYLPPHRIDICKNLQWVENPFILQFNRAHTGRGTMLVASGDELQKLHEQFPNRPVKISEYIQGPVFTNNNVVASDAILVGNISYQITGLAPFTDHPFATIGNDWGFATKLLSYEQKKYYAEMATTIGEKLRADGWKGLFGIDVIMDEKTGHVYLLEINARQPASAIFESQLQQHAYILYPNPYTLTTFDAHLAALLDLPLAGYQLIEIDDGAQIILRNNSFCHSERSEAQSRNLVADGFTAIPYRNTVPGSDLLRIQSKMSIMEGHNRFNTAGKKIQKICQSI